MATNYNSEYDVQQEFHAALDSVLVRVKNIVEKNQGPEPKISVSLSTRQSEKRTVVMAIASIRMKIYG